MLTYQGTETKDQVIERLKEHARLDQIVQGTYWKDGKGCAVGCLTHEPHGGHYEFPERWGIPVAFAHLIDVLFEMLPVEESKGWPLRVMSAIPVGADLSGVWDRYALWMLMDDKFGLINIATDSREIVAAMGELFQRAVDGDEPSTAEWDSLAARAAHAALAARTDWDYLAAQAAQAAQAARVARSAWADWAARAARAAWAAQAARVARSAWADYPIAACDELVRILESIELKP